MPILRRVSSLPVWLSKPPSHTDRGRGLQPARASDLGRYSIIINFGDTCSVQAGSSNVQDNGSVLEYCSIQE